MSLSGIKTKNRRLRITIRFHLIRLCETQGFKGSNNYLLMTISCVYLSYRPITSLTSTVNCTTSSLARKGPTGCCESSLKCRPLQSRKFLLLKSGAWVWKSRIQVKESAIPLASEIRNPISSDKESGSSVLESGIHDVESRIQGFKEVDDKTYSNFAFILILTKLISRGSKSA